MILTTKRRYGMSGSTRKTASIQRLIVFAVMAFFALGGAGLASPAPAYADYQVPADYVGNPLVTISPNHLAKLAERVRERGPSPITS